MDAAGRFCSSCTSYSTSAETAMATSNGSSKRPGTDKGPAAAKRPAFDKRLTRLQVMLTDDELRAVDDFRFQKRMPSRAAAVREVLRRGLAADGFKLADDGARSGQFGVISDGNDGAAATRGQRKNGS